MSYFLTTINFISKQSQKYLTGNDISIFKRFLKYIKTVNHINSTFQYNNFIQKTISSVKDIKFKSLKSFPIYEKEIIQISKSAPLTEKTPWGGVSLKNVDVEKNYIRKLLVIAKHGVLGFEIHKLKNEKLKILEGICLILYSNHTKKNWEKGKISVKFGVLGDKFEFLPNDEHGIIALSNTVIEETSTNHLNDLVYIFAASQQN